jgi:hypothetical protein
VARVVRMAEALLDRAGQAPQLVRHGVELANSRPRADVHLLGAHELTTLPYRQTYALPRRTRALVPPRRAETNLGF